MKLVFAYDLEKDLDNIIQGALSVNNRQPTKLQQAYIDRLGPKLERNLLRSFVIEYLDEHHIQMEEKRDAFEQDWIKIEEKFTDRAKTLFGIEIPGSYITAYLTTNSRCTYSIQEQYFFVSINSQSSVGTVLHELWHFYTWHAFHANLEKQGLSKAEYNDLKESLTEILNLEFADLLKECPDRGYPQHAILRRIIREEWITQQSMEAIVKILAYTIKNKKVEYIVK